MQRNKCSTKAAETNYEKIKSKAKQNKGKHVLKIEVRAGAGEAKESKAKVKKGKHGPIKQNKAWPG